MSRRKKVLLWINAILLIILIAAFFVANALLDQATRKAMTHVTQVANKQGLEIAEPRFESAKLSGLLSAHWSGLRAKIRLPEGADSESNRLWDVHVNHLKVRKGLSENSVVEIDRVTITSGAEPGDENTHDQGKVIPASQRIIKLENIRCECPLSLFNPGKSLRTILPEVIRLLTATEFNLPLELEGYLLFSLRGDPIEIGIEVKKTEDLYVLRLTSADLARVSERFDEKLTEAEVELIAGYPLRAARLLEIKDTAEVDSSAAHQRDTTVPKDAYRHILWSFLLTNVYDADFAKRVGDAHEKGETGNTPAEREMDYHNNAIGRSYSEKKYIRGSLLKRLLADSNVQREP